MKERPILFSGSMVRAILDGTKTQTRRIVKPQPTGNAPGVYADLYNHGPQWAFWLPDNRMTEPRTWPCPFGVPGDRLWVRERTWERPERTPRMMREGADTWAPREYDADLDDGDREQFREWGWRSRPSIHMPRAASRIILEVVSVRVERLQAITDEDAKAEGVGSLGMVVPMEATNLDGSISRGTAHIFNPVTKFAILWDRINGKRASWESNPYVWVVEFKKVEVSR